MDARSTWRVVDEFGQPKRVRLDIEAWGDRLQRFSEHGARVEVTLKLVVIAAFIGGGLALLIGLGWMLGALVGACSTAACIAALWLRARRRGTKVFGDDWFS
jgi:hypothetical protein